MARRRQHAKPRRTDLHDVTRREQAVGAGRIVVVGNAKRVVPAGAHRELDVGLGHGEGGTRGSHERAHPRHVVGMSVRGTDELDLRLREGAGDARALRARVDHHGLAVTHHGIAVGLDGPHHELADLEPAGHDGRHVVEGHGPPIPKRHVALLSSWGASPRQGTHRARAPYPRRDIMFAPSPGMIRRAS